MEVIGTGVEVRWPPSVAGNVVDVQVFAETATDGIWYGTVFGTSQPIPADGDPTSYLLDITGAANYHLGDLLGDMRIGGLDVTRWELYSAPFRIVLSPALRERFVGRWRPRDPA